MKTLVTNWSAMMWWLLVASHFGYKPLTKDYKITKITIAKSIKIPLINQNEIEILLVLSITLKTLTVSQAEGLASRDLPLPVNLSSSVSVPQPRIGI